MSDNESEAPASTLSESSATNLTTETEVFPATFIGRSFGADWAKNTSRTIHRKPSANWQSWRGSKTSRKGI